MPIFTLSYDGKCEVKLVIDIHGTKEQASVVVDTGFVSDTGFGLKLPVEFAEYANYTGTGTVILGDGTSRDVESIADAKIIQIEGHQLKNEVTIPALFMGGKPVIGVMFLQLCILGLDGPSKVATIEF